jgi:C-terminal processing protease CtpA/Prc
MKQLIVLIVFVVSFVNIQCQSSKDYKGSEDNTQFSDSSYINLKTVNNQQVVNLDKLGKIWGMMKYFHPAVAQGEYNWDYELFRIMPEIIEAQSDSVCDLLLINWLHQFGNFELDTNSPIVKNSLKMSVDLKWTKNNKLLSLPLMSFLDSLKNAKKSNEHYYIDFVQGIGNPIFKNENTYQEMTYPDAGYRLLSLFRYWNMVQYFFPYKYLIGEDWNVVLSEFIPKFVDAKNTLEYQTTLLKLIARINDTHANIYQSDIALDIARGIYIAPFDVKFIENKAVVAEITNDTLIKKTGISKGDIITKINGKTIEQIVEELKPISPASNEPTRLRNIALEMIRSQNSFLTIEYQHNGKIKTDTVICQNRLDYYNNNIQPKKPSYQLLPSNIGYIYIETLKRDSVSFIMKKLKNTQGIVIDLRCYPSDFALYELGNYLMPYATDFAKFTRTDLTNIGDFYFDESVSTIGKKNAKYYKGKIAILVDEGTQSSAEFHAMAFQVAPQAVVIGSTTAGADGNISRIGLPGGIRTLFTGIGVYYPNGTETQRIGIVPNIEIKPTIEGFQAERDEILEKAIEWIKQK